MSTSNACGLGFGAGLVTAITAAIIWRSPLMTLTIRWLFDSTGTREAARARR